MTVDFESRVPFPTRQRKLRQIAPMLGEARAMALSRVAPVNPLRSASPERVQREGASAALVRGMRVAVLHSRSIFVHGSATRRFHVYFLSQHALKFRRYNDTSHKFLEESSNAGSHFALSDLQPVMISA